MSVWEYQYTDELYHHGIKGQKWGVRRYQNSNGTLTSAGRQRYSDKPKRKLTSDEKKAIAKKVGLGLAGAAALAGAGAATAYGIKHPEDFKFAKAVFKPVMSELGDRAKSHLPNFVTSDKTKAFVSNAGKKAIKSLGESTSRAGKAMTEAMIASAGTIAISKLAKKYAILDTDDEETRQAKQMILDTSTAGITAFTSAGSSSSKSSKGSGKTQAIGKDITNAIGSPSNKGVDKQSPEYQGLFKGRDADTRMMIKSLASGGFDIDQINDYLHKRDTGVIQHNYAYAHDELLLYRIENYIDSCSQIRV